MKKEFFILGLIITILVIGLAVQKKGRIHYTLPEIAGLNRGKIDKIMIKGTKNDIALEKKDDTWILQPAGYPADKSKVSAMIDALSDLSITALVSKKGRCEPYDLTDAKKLSVKVYASGAVTRSLDIGKAASSWRHTFVRLGEDKCVYQASGNIRGTFDKSVDDLRDKTVMALDDEISLVELKKGKQAVVIRRREQPVDLNKAGKEQGKDQLPKGSVWINDSGKSVPDDKIDGMLRDLADLKCEKYIEGKTKQDFHNPSFTITLTGGKKWSLSLYEKEDNRYQAVSSVNDYPFYLSKWRAEKLMPEELFEK